MATVFVRAANPIWWLPDHTGVSLNDEYYAFFLTNTLPYIPQAVYQDPAGDVQFSNPIEFSPAGTLPDNLYFDPTLVYRIEIRHGNTQADALIWEINNFIPGDNGGGTIVVDNLTVADNVITNPQFADISFQSPFTYMQSSPSTYTVPVGPGWDLILTGAGTTVLSQTAIAGSSNIAGNPPYYLDINNTGWTSAVLRQRLENNGAIFANGAVAVAFSAASVSNSETLTVTYAPSSGAATNIIQRSIPTGTLTAYKNAVDLPASTNASTGASAYVDILFTMDGNSHLQLTNIQITGQSTNLSSGFDNPEDAPSFHELTYEQVVNGEFNVYRDPLIFKPIPSYLVGWDFPLNPNQFSATPSAAVATGANGSFYVWDQTIVFQGVDSSITADRFTANELDLSSASATKLAIIQYLGPEQAKKILNNRISVNLSAYTNDAPLTGTISLYYTKDASLPSASSPDYDSLVATLDANGKPATFNGNWIEVPRPNMADAKFILGVATTTNFNNYSFNGWDMEGVADVDLATFFAIVIGFEEIAINHNIFINSVGLCSGDIPTIPAPQTLDEVLSECQYYYEKSYDITDIPGDVTNRGQILIQQLPFLNGTPAISLVSRSYMISYNTLKRITNPVITFYSPTTGTADRVHGYTRAAGAALANGDITQSTNWINESNGQKYHTWVSANTSDLVGPTNSAGSYAEAYITFHFTSDCRLGI